MILVVLPFVALFVNIVTSQSYQPCHKSGVNGFCKPIKACESAVKILLGPRTPQDSQFLRNIQCAYGGQPWVCCATVKKPPLQGLLPKAPQCGNIAHDRIFGGTATRIDEFPWLVQIQYNEPQNEKCFRCGGSLINERYVLTAAHCVSKIPTTWNLTSVRLGEWDTSTTNDCDDSHIGETFCSDPVVDILVEKKIVHENYESNSKNQHNDIALLRLAKTVKYTDFVKPICLPLDTASGSETLGGVQLDVSGWGRTETSWKSQKKLKVNITSYSNAACKNFYSNLRDSNRQILDSQICAGGEPGKDSCGGDSGGPLMQDYPGARRSLPHYSLVGIVSYGPNNCGTKDFPGVYTRVSKYIEWIESKIRD